MKFNDDDLYGVSAALEAVGVEGIDANRLDIDDIAVALLHVAVGGTSSP